MLKRTVSGCNKHSGGLWGELRFKLWLILDNFKVRNPNLVTGYSIS